MSVVQRTLTFGRMIKFTHSIFALPFAFVSGLVAFHLASVTISPTDILLLLVCMVSARTAAMGFNRLADRDIDAVNPRTRNREIPSGSVSVLEARLFTAIAAIVFVIASFLVNSLCGWLSFPLLGLLLGYTLTKRFTTAAHFVLGACLGAAPVGVWFAMTGSFSWIPIVLGLGVMFWTAGFDIYYSCQDEAFDRAQGLRSLPARVGAIRAIQLVRVVHLVAIGLFVSFGLLAGMGLIFFVGAALVSAILVYEAWLLRTGDLSRIDLAFFNLNGYVSIVFAVATALDILLR